MKIRDFVRACLINSTSRAMWRFAGLIVLVSLLLSACALPKALRKGEPAATPTGEAATQAASVLVDNAPTATEAEPDPATPTAQSVEKLSASDFTGPDGAALGGLILFTSQSEDPFANLDLGAPGLPSPERHLWAVSPDGMRAGRISPAGMGSALYLPQDSQGPVRFIANGLTPSHAALEPVTPPAECLPGGGAGCSGYNFGPEGRTLAYYTSSASCGRDLALVDLVFNETISTWTNVHWYYFLQDGSLVLSLGDCADDQRIIYLYIPNKDSQAGLGPEGDMIWDPSGQAALVRVHIETKLQSGLWGLNMDTSRVFLWMEKDDVIDDTPIWLPDGQHFIYQHRPVQYHDDYTAVTLEGPRQIILMNAWSRDQRLLAYDSRYDYHVCDTTGEPCELRYGDWIRVRRTPFRPMRVQAEDSGLPAARCGLYGLDCQDQPEELMALNWKTGELLPWDEAGPAEVEPPPAFPQPDLSGQPVYSDPGGQYNLFTGPGGRTLWYVPAEGDPVLWVSEGENFVYLP